MIWVLSSVLLFLPAATPQNSTAKGGFEQLARRAEAARTGGKFADAIQLYREGLKIRPAWSEGWWGLSSIFYEQDRFGEAAEAFNRFISTSKTDPGPAYAFLGLCEYETGEYRKAAENFGTWVRKGLPGNAQLIEVASFHWTLVLTLEGHFVQALYLLEDKAKRYGITPALVEAVGLASLRMKNVPVNYPPESREMVWLAGRASVHGSLHDFSRAHEFAHRLTAHYGREPNVHYLYGTIYNFEQRVPEAAEEFRRELEISPDHAPALIQLALIGLLENNLEGAEAMASKAAALEPQEPLARYALGRVLIATGRFQDAARELEAAKKIAPTSAKVRYQLATAYRRLRRIADADRENAAFEAMKNKNEVLAAIPGDTTQPAPRRKARVK
jgi:tetratricopeptide (TPR) repeat protein